MSRRGLSLVEWVVSTAILLILLSIFIPYLLKVREQNNRSRCADNLRLLGGALADYAARNGGDYPRVVYAPAVAPVGYTAFTGADAATPFARNSAVSPSDVTASLWLLVRLKLADPADFICPSTTDTADPLLDIQGRPTSPDRRSNFRGPLSLSFSYACPFGDAPGYRLNDTRRAGFALMADRAPDLSTVPVLPSSTADPLTLAVANSTNHARAGQNVLYAQGDVEFESTPYCGVDHDNIYTAAPRAAGRGAGGPVGGSAGGSAVGPADQVGSQGVALSPGSAIDSFLVPAAGDPVGIPLVLAPPPPPPPPPPPRPLPPPTTRKISPIPPATMPTGRPVPPLPLPPSPLIPTTRTGAPSDRPAPSPAATRPSRTTAPA